MGCYYPMIRAETFDGKIKISKASEDEVINDAKMKKIRKYMYKRYDLIPCGKCIGCRLEYSRQWATRIMLEAKTTKNNWFITLTYNDLNVPSKTICETGTGELIEKTTLKKEDLQDFIKRLRRYYEYHYQKTNIRFYAAGEYGSETERPHYHLCIFNMPIDEDKLKKYKNNVNGDALYTCEEIEKIWGKGFVTIGSLTYESAAYTARYIMKKQIGKESEDYYQGREREFTIMSRKPGIGKTYYDQKNEEIYKTDKIAIRGRYTQPPKYFDELKTATDEDLMRKIKNKRKLKTELRETAQAALSTQTKQERREIEERSKKEAMKACKRII